MWNIYINIYKRTNYIRVEETNYSLFFVRQMEERIVSAKIQFIYYQTSVSMMNMLRFPTLQYLTVCWLCSKVYSIIIKLISLLIIYMKKFLKCDWLRAVQFLVQCQKMKYNAKKIQLKFLNFLFFKFLNFLLRIKISKCDLRTWLHNFSCILLISNSMVSRAIWKNTLVLRTRAVLIVFEKLTHVHGFLPNCTRNHTIIPNGYKYLWININ